MADRISSLDEGYQSGDLSLFPLAIDDKEILYEAKNNAETKLKNTLTYNGKYVVVEDATSFPSAGIIRIGPKSGVGTAELIYYGARNDYIFSDLIRGFAGSRQNSWTIQDSYVTGPVVAEHHNAIKDAILNLQSKMGVLQNPSDLSLNGILQSLERRFLAPKPIFRAFPLIGLPPLKVRFQSYGDGNVIRYLWNFGDGSTSIEKNPIHSYAAEGIYTVQLNVITSSGAHGIAIKTDYITISADANIPFFYVELQDSSQPAYSIETAAALGKEPATFIFVDQTDGDIAQRFWVFDDGEQQTISDPDIHTTTHMYQKKGEYEPNLLVFMDNQKTRRVLPQEKLIVL